ncbi:hypothetical protein HanXRQr2_Chr17g0803051 [Helianthus annuus]|uniref:Uncharacterized protein n=1 Tax=Helianthus annuus TaxID=4232 RepID=A0A9K3DHL5_HELAN|nr:hypothetical protein HanXRQr2_Chr17g0803051 [Helianthus annuus]
MSGIVAMDIATRTTYPEAANHVGMLSFKNTVSRFCCSACNSDVSESEKFENLFGYREILLFGAIVPNGLNRDGDNFNQIIKTVTENKGNGYKNLQKQKTIV